MAASAKADRQNLMKSLTKQLTSATVHLSVTVDHWFVRNSVRSLRKMRFIFLISSICQMFFSDFPRLSPIACGQKRSIGQAANHKGAALRSDNTKVAFRLNDTMHEAAPGAAIADPAALMYQTS